MTAGEAAAAMSSRATADRPTGKPTTTRISPKGPKPARSRSSRAARTPTPAHVRNAQDLAPMTGWRRRGSSCRERRKRGEHRGIRLPPRTERSSPTPLWRRTRTAVADTAVNERGRHPLGGTGAASAAQGLGGITSAAGLETSVRAVLSIRLAEGCASIFCPHLCRHTVFSAQTHSNRSHERSEEQRTRRDRPVTSAD